jgi:uncharacterized membrane protein
METGVSVIRAIIAFFLLFLVPGFAWTLVLFKKLSILERIALSFGLSIAMVTITILGVNVALHVRITGTNSLIIVGALTVIPIVIYLFLRKRRQGSEISDGE